MITDEVIKLASNTKFYGLKNNFTHKKVFLKIKPVVIQLK